MSRRGDDVLDEHKRQCLEMIAFYRQEYERAIKPYVEQLVHIENLRPVTRHILLAQAISLGLI